jgi:heptosyltransferase II
MAIEPAVLVIGPNWVGDAVMAQCLFATLKRQSALRPIDVVGPASVLPLFRRMPQVRAGIASPFGHGDFSPGRRIALGMGLRGRYTEAYVLPGSWKSALVPAAAGIARRCGYLKEWRYGLLNDRRTLPAHLTRKTALTYQALADPDVIANLAMLIEPKLDVDSANRNLLLDRSGLAAGRFAAFAPGAEYGDAKRWPLHHWAQLSDMIGATGLKTVLLGSGNDRAVGQAIAAGRPHVIDLTGATRLEDAIDLISACAVAVTNDSGLMHIAAATGSPVIAIYGSTSPADTPPLSKRAGIVSLDLSCSPCRARVCPLGHTRCLSELTPSAVFARLPSAVVM